MSKQNEDTETSFELPDWDAINMRPRSKMPLCPKCGQDELGMITEDSVICYYCGLGFYKNSDSAEWTTITPT